MAGRLNKPRCSAKAGSPNWTPRILPRSSEIWAAEFNSLVSALRVLTMHLLKWDHQPEKRSRSWELTIASQRLELADILKDSPGLKPRFDEALARAYRRARLEASSETGLDASVFPEACPYDLWAIATREIALR